MKETLFYSPKKKIYGINSSVSKNRVFIANVNTMELLLTYMTIHLLDTSTSPVIRNIRCCYKIFVGILSEFRAFQLY